MPELRDAPKATPENCDWQDIDTIILGVPCPGCDVMDGYAAEKPGIRSCKLCGRRVELGEPWEGFVRERIDSGLYRLVGDGRTIMMIDDWAAAIHGMRDRMAQLFGLSRGGPTGGMGGTGTGAKGGFIVLVALVLALSLFGYIAAQWRPSAVQRPVVNQSPAPTVTSADLAPSAAGQAPLDLPPQAKQDQQSSSRVEPIGFGSALLTAEEEYWLRVRNAQGRATGPSDRQPPQSGSNGEGAPSRNSGLSSAEQQIRRQTLSDLAQQRYRASQDAAFDRYGETMRRADCYRDYRTCEEAERMRNVELVQARREYEAAMANVRSEQ